LGVLGGMVVSVMLGSGIVSFFFRGRRVYFSQDYMCRVLKNCSDCGICSVSERLRRYFTTMKLCSESAKGRLANFLASADVSASESLVCRSFKRLEW